MWRIITWLFIISLTLVSCRKDVPPALSCDPNHPDKICREDAFERGQYIGCIDYKYYSNHLLYQKSYHSTQNSFLKETFTYNSALLLERITGQDENDKLVQEQIFERTPFDSLETMTIKRNGTLTQYTIFEYDSLHRLITKVTSDADVFSEFRYIYTDDGNVYKESSYNVSGELQGYKIFHHYLNHIQKIFSYNTNDDLLGIRVIMKNKEDLLLEVRDYNPDNQLINRELYVYDGQLLHKKSVIKDEQEISFRLFHYP